MKEFKGFKAERSGGRDILPAGGYVAKIIGARIDNFDSYSKLVIAFDVDEGKFAGFFKKDFDNNTREDKKWRGTLRLTVPVDDGSEKDEWSKKAFGRAMWAVEKSNPGYHWDWDEGKLKGKTVGVLFRNREWDMNGNTGWTTECCAFDSAQRIRDNEFKMPKDKPLPTKSASANYGGFTPIIAEESDELPF